MRLLSAPVLQQVQLRYAVLSDVGTGRLVGLLVVLLQECGLNGLAQVDLGTRRHSHQTDEALGTMAGQIVNTLLARAERGRHGRRLEPGGLLTQFRHDGERFVPMSTAVAVDQRPPMATVAEYALLQEGCLG